MAFTIEYFTLVLMYFNILQFLFQDPNRPKYKWFEDHTENMSGTNEQYVPYSTTRPKIEAWVPPKPK